MSYLVLLGAGQLQARAVEAAHDLGLKVLAFDGNAKAFAKDSVDVFVHLDISKPDEICAYIEAKGYNNKISGVFTAGTDFSAQVAYVADHFGLPSIGYEVGLNASQKSRMRALFMAHGVNSPQFHLIMPGDPLVVPDHLRLPLVVKPSNNMGARGVSKILDRAEFAPAYELALSHSKGRGVLVEEFIEGQEYSIDSLVIDGRVHEAGLAIRHIHFPPYFVELGHTMPALLTEDQYKAFMIEFQKAVTSIGIKNGVAKGDVFIGPHGVVIGEIAARLSGGFMSGWTYPYASGFELTKAAVLIATGQSPKSLPTRNYQNASAERGIISIPGRVKSVPDLEVLKKNYGAKDIFLRADVGQVLKFPSNNVEKAGNVIAVHKDRNSAIKIAQETVSDITIGLEPFGQETLDYLASDFHDPFLLGREGSYPLAYPRLYAHLKDHLPDTGLVLKDSEPEVYWPKELDNFGNEVCLWNYMALSTVKERLSTLCHLSPDTRGSSFLLYLLAKGGIQAAIFVIDSVKANAERAKNLWGRD